MNNDDDASDDEYPCVSISNDSTIDSLLNDNENNSLDSESNHEEEDQEDEKAKQKPKAKGPVCLTDKAQDTEALPEVPEADDENTPNKFGRKKGMPGYRWIEGEYIPGRYTKWHIRADDHYDQLSPQRVYGHYAKCEEVKTDRKKRYGF